MRYRVFAYRQSYNLGDAIQTIALSRLLPGKVIGDYRDLIKGGHPLLVANGFLEDDAKPTGDALFAGIYTPTSAAVNWLKQSSYLIGARDPSTQMFLRSYGVKSDLIGCATMTFPRYDGPRQGIIEVDTINHSCLTQFIPAGMSWAEQWCAALVRLEQIRRAELVITSRLHIALPCLAFGTPVVIPSYVRNTVAFSNRLSVLDWVIFPYDEPVKKDISSYAAGYKRWLGERLQTEIVEHEPVFPAV